MNAMVGNSKYFYTGYLTIYNATCYLLLALHEGISTLTTLSTHTTLDKFIKRNSHSYLADGCVDKMKVVIFHQVSSTDITVRDIERF